jgi:hypothetical protein
MTFKPSQNGAMTNVGFAMATIDAFIDHMGEGRIDDVYAETGKHRTAVGDGKNGTQFFKEVIESKPRLGAEKLQMALIMSAIEDSFRLTPVVGTEYYHKEFYLKRYENRAKRWLRGEGGYWSAAECFETLGIDYRKALAKLEAAWLKHRQTGEVMVEKTRRAESGRGNKHTTVNA